MHHVCFGEGVTVNVGRQLIIDNQSPWGIYDRQRFSKDMSLSASNTANLGFLFHYPPVT